MGSRRRTIKVATVSHRPDAGVDSPSGLDRLMKGTETLVTRAARLGADLVAFPERYPQHNIGDPFHHAEPADGGTLPRVQELARRHNLYLVWPRIEYEAARGLRNTSILVDRSGDVLGRYDKMFPTVGELEKGCVPGTEAPAFETDFGKVGMLICFDLNFPEARASLAKSRPDLVIFSSMYRGGLQARMLAYDLGAFVVTAIGSELGVIIDRCGGVLKESTYETLAVAPINTNSIALHMDFNWNKMDEMLAKYPRELGFDYHTREAFFTVESTGDRDVSSIVQEFHLETAADYYERSRRMREASMAKFEAGRAKA